jgi:bifunctional NMN adenylyltransferase/nudix hydrolase
MTTAIIIARFQVPDLTIGHRALIASAYHDFDQIGFLLGSPLTGPNLDNPLAFTLRAPMVREFEPVFIREIYDIPGNNGAWSVQVDVAIGMSNAALGDVTLVGGRKSFIPSYEGKYPTKAYDIWKGKSGTEVRRAVASEPLHTVEFRRGVIWQVMNGK